MSTQGKWKPIQIADGFFFAADSAGFLGLEEIDHDDFYTDKEIEKAKSIKHSKQQNKGKEKASKEEKKKAKFGIKNKAAQNENEKKRKLDDDHQIVIKEEESGDYAKHTKQQEKEGDVSEESQKISLDSKLKHKTKVVKTEIKQENKGEKNEHKQPPKKKNKTKTEDTIDEKKVEQKEKIVIDRPVSLPNWEGFNLHASVLKALHRNGFTTPTPIQKLALPVSIKSWKDVIGAAETGSGKNFSFWDSNHSKNFGIERKSNRRGKKRKESSCVDHHTYT